MPLSFDPPLGATPSTDGTLFHLWAPFAKSVDVRLVAPREETVSLEQAGGGYWRADVPGAPPGTLYAFRIDGGDDRPDPASRFQPQGVHGPSQVVDSSFGWTDSEWRGLSMRDYVIYELHTGTFTPEGTFEAIVSHLPYLRDLGVTAVELMPVAQFPGSRNWGYDGVHPYAVQESYGGPEGLRALVDACHRAGLAVVLDVVYNHLGPEGNYLRDFGPYFTDRYKTPWGAAINYDGPYSDGVRRYFIENALYWVTDFHIDALRLDAVHAIADHSAVTFLEELAGAVHERADELGREILVTAESDMNEARLVRPPDRGGYGMDATWSDDFHHSLHALLTGERSGYYEDFGEIEHLAKSLRTGFTYTGEYSPFRKRRHGSDPSSIPPHRFIVCSQNHDQTGNRALGERMAELAPFEALKLAAGATLLSPFTPLLFMGEEYGETAPFQYFVSHSDPGLVEAVRRGRREEFSAFGWQGDVPDPMDEATFLRSKLDHTLRSRGHHAVLLDLYRELLSIRTRLRIPHADERSVDVYGGQILTVLYRTGKLLVLVMLNAGDSSASARVPVPAGRWTRILDSAAERWNGPGETIPPEIDSDGGIDIELGPFSFATLHFGGE